MHSTAAICHLSSDFIFIYSTYSLFMIKILLNEQKTEAQLHVSVASIDVSFTFMMEQNPASLCSLLFSSFI